MSINLRFLSHEDSTVCCSLSKDDSTICSFCIDGSKFVTDMPYSSMANLIMIVAGFNHLVSSQKTYKQEQFGLLKKENSAEITAFILLTNTSELWAIYGDVVLQN